MSKSIVIYWSGTGNTEAMAMAVAEGIREAGSEAIVCTAGSVSTDLLEDAAGVAFGCPAMGAEELEDTEFAPAFEACSDQLSGKKVALFGSYGWGDGEWMRSWEEECAAKGIELTCESVTANEAPDAEAVEACKSLGRKIA